MHMPSTVTVLECQRPVVIVVRYVLQVEGMRRPGFIVGDTSGAESSAVGASVSFDKILAAVLDNNDEVLNIVTF